MKLIPLLLGTALIFAGTLTISAQDKSTASKESKEVQQNTTTTTQHSKVKTSTDTVYGKVESYDPGKSLKVTVPGKIVSTKSFDLDSKDWTYHITPHIKAGEWVRVTEKTGNNGHKTLSVEPSSQRAASRVKRESDR